MALINRSEKAVAGVLRAVARKRERYTHDVKAGRHNLTVDEPESQGGQDMGPSPQELLAAALASCTAVTMEMYAERKGWNVDGLEVDCRYSPAERGCPTRFEMIMRMPAHLSEQQVERLQVIAAKCPVHRTLEGEVAFDERVELHLSRIAEQLSAALLTPEEALGMVVHGGRVHSAVLVPLFCAPDDRLHAVFTKRREDLSRHAGEISFPGGRRDEGETLLETALREAWEEVGLPASEVSVIGALAPVGTVATDYAIYPFVGLMEHGFEWVRQETEVAEVLEFALDDLVAGHSFKRLVRREIAFRTDVYEVDGHMVWGATARIFSDLLRRLGVGPPQPWRLQPE